MRPVSWRMVRAGLSAAAGAAAALAGLPKITGTRAAFSA